MTLDVATRSDMMDLTNDGLDKRMATASRCPDRGVGTKALTQQHFLVWKMHVESLVCHIGMNITINTLE